jgi:hypothetical protein
LLPASRARAPPLQAAAEAARLRADVGAARADNVALVERLRYVQGYAQQQRGRKGELLAGSHVMEIQLRLHAWRCQLGAA